LFLEVYLHFNILSLLVEEVVEEVLLAVEEPEVVFV
jgi:hypothetical protein